MQIGTDIKRKVIRWMMLKLITESNRTLVTRTLLFQLGHNLCTNKSAEYSDIYVNARVKKSIFFCSYPTTPMFLLYFLNRSLQLDLNLQKKLLNIKYFIPFNITSHSFWYAEGYITDWCLNFIVIEASLNMYPLYSGCHTVCNDFSVRYDATQK